MKIINDYRCEIANGFPNLIPFTAIYGIAKTAFEVHSLAIAAISAGSVSPFFMASVTLIACKNFVPAIALSVFTQLQKALTYMGSYATDLNSRKALEIKGVS